MRKAIDIAHYFLELFKFDEEGLSNLKLNKLLYYAQGFSYQRFSKPLFSDDIEAWPYGPVVAEVYKAFQPCGKNPITPIGKEPELTSEEEDLLIDVAREYGKCSASGLVSLTHKSGSSWSMIYTPHMDGNVIPKSLIEDYFKTKEKQLDSPHVDFGEDDFIGYRDEDGYLVLPKEYDN